MRSVTRITRLLIVIVSGLSISAHLSAADEKLRVTGGITWTAVSGYTGSIHDLGNSKGDTRSIVGIEWFEQYDDPCHVTVITNHLNNYSNRNYNYTEGPCSKPGNKKMAILLGNADSIYKIKVCTTDKKKSIDNKLKGIRVWSRSVASRSPLQLTAQSSYREAKHTNCKKWHQTVSCPAGQVATKIRAHFANHPGMTGIALGCQKIILDKG